MYMRIFIVYLCWLRPRSSSQGLRRLLDTPPALEQDKTQRFALRDKTKESLCDIAIIYVMLYAASTFDQASG